MARLATTSETVVAPHRQQASASAAGNAVARDWWVVALRGLAALLFGVGVLTAPRPAVAALVWLFATYVAADGALAIFFASRAGRRGERWRALLLEGAINLGVAGVVLIWPVVALVAFIPLTSAWAIVTGGLLLAAAHRLDAPGRRALAGAGFVSAAWGAAASAADWVSGRTAGGTGWWLIGYAALFGGTLLLVAVQLQRHHRRARRAAQLETADSADLRVLE
jgi:uncharacterized membrane protein HdeD (DUF308 family)